MASAIMSYGGQGTTKPGVHAHEHAVVYTTDTPEYLSNEMPLEKAPIKIRPYTSQHKLDRASRLNYAKLYTIEYNVKVWFIGEVDRGSTWKLMSTYDQVHPPLSKRYSDPNQNYPLASSSGTGAYQPPQQTQYSNAAYSANLAPAYYSVAGTSNFPASSSTSQPIPTSAQRVAISPYTQLQTAQYGYPSSYGAQRNPYPDESQNPDEREDNSRGY